MTCYKCNRKVTTKDDIVFVATLPVHYNSCPKVKRNGKKS